MSGYDFAVSVASGALHFNAAHFITIGDLCENLHGHNFHVRVDVRGHNNPDGFVVDFVLLDRVAKEVCGELHDRILLPGRNPAVSLGRADGAVDVRCLGRRWLLPEENCAVLPVVNASAEGLAQHIAGQLLERLPPHALAHAAELEVAVEEADRQWGIHRRELAHGA